MSWFKKNKNQKIKCILDTEILFCNDLQVQCIVLSLRACSDHKRFPPKHNSMLHAYENTSVKCSRKRKESNITVISASPTVRPSAFVRKPCRPPTSGYWGIMGKRITFIIIWTKSKTNLNSTVLYYKLSRYCKLIKKNKTIVQTNSRNFIFSGINAIKYHLTGKKNDIQFLEHITILSIHTFFKKEF